MAACSEQARAAASAEPRAVASEEAMGGAAAAWMEAVARVAATVAAMDGAVVG